MKNLDQYILFDLVCHLGTLLAIFFIFSSQIMNLVNQSTRVKQLLLATLPLFPLVLVMKPIKAVYADPAYLGYFFLVTAFILFLGVRFGKTVPEARLEKHTWRDALVIGAWQACAILPGISRSGSTISGARLLGWSPNEAVTFSFLLAIPAILGGATLECVKCWQHSNELPPLPLSHYLTGFFVSFVIGILALKLLISVVTHNKFSYFAWYCLILGLATTAYFHLW